MNTGEKSNKKVEVQKESDTIAYSELWKTCDVLYKKANEDSVGCFHLFKASLVFAAFTFEAFLNHVGSKKCPCWPYLERRLGPEEKLGLISEHIGLKVDYNQLPWKILKELLPFRHSHAHAKSKKFVEKKTLPIDGYEDYLNTIERSNWDKYCNQTEVARIRNQLEKMMREIWTTAGFEEHDLFRPGMTFGSVSLKQ